MVIYFENLQNTDIGERACAFAREMKSTENAEFDGEKLTIDLVEGANENVVKAAVLGFIGSLDRTVMTSDEKCENKQPQTGGNFFVRAALTIIMAAFGAALSGTTSLFAFIASYIIISWDIFAEIPKKIKEKDRFRFVDMIIGIAAAVMFIIGWYLPAIIIAFLHQTIKRRIK